MKGLKRLLAAVLVTLVAGLGGLAAPASAGQPAEIGQCVITINLPRAGTIEIPICSNGPPL